MMTQQDIENTISASFDSLSVCHEILSGSITDLVSGSINGEEVEFPKFQNEDELRYTLNKNREALEWIVIEEWFETTVDDSKVTEYEHIISASKSFNSII